MRPDHDQLLQSLRVSLNDTVAPAVTDRWARYVATAMDLVLQHLQLRLAGESDAIGADNADMALSLAELAASTTNDRLAAALTPLDNEAAPGDLAGATALNERLRAQIVAALRVVDAAAPDDPEAERCRDALHRLIRRQVDRVGVLVEPLHMSFGPAVAS